MKLTIGLFGFGKTGSIVANEIIKDTSCELKWVIRQSSFMKELMPADIWDTNMTKD